MRSWGTITSLRIAEVPLNGRSYTNLFAVQTVAPVTISATSSTSFGAVSAQSRPPED